MKFDLKNVGRVIDISAVRADVTIGELEDLVTAAKKYRFIAAFAMPCFTEYLVNALKDEDYIMACGVVGFPSGADLTSTKIQNAKEMMALGCDELDMVINIGALKSGIYDAVYNDIKAVVNTAGEKGIGVKSIIEQCYLTDDEIKKASEIAVRAGVAYVKTGTGWGPKPTTVNTIKIIKSTIGDAAKIKAAGGVRSLDTLLEMMDAGCNRFGIGLKSAIAIMEEAQGRLCSN